jgi:hypothetical protein
MIKTLVFLSASFSFWLTELFLLITARIFQVRKELINWRSLPEERHRVLFLVLGLWAFISFATIHRMKATYAWVKNEWLVAANDTLTLLYLPLGIAGVLMLLWWVFGAVFSKWGKVIWWTSLALGLSLGLGIVAYDFLDEGVNLFSGFK